jgi:hypothetical protein
VVFRHDIMTAGPDGEPAAVRPHIRQVENDPNLELVAIAMAIGVPRRTGKTGYSPRTYSGRRGSPIRSVTAATTSALPAVRS